jgi:hypothetical protein
LRSLAVAPEVLQIFGSTSGGLGASGCLPAGVKHFEKVATGWATEILVSTFADGSAIYAPETKSGFGGGFGCGWAHSGLWGVHYIMHQNSGVVCVSKAQSRSEIAAENGRKDH